MKIKCAQIGSIQLQLVQPGQGQSQYKEFLQSRGEGVYHLGLVVDDIDQSEADVTAMGLDVISKGRRTDSSGLSYLNTAQKGGVTLLIRQSPPGQ